MKELDFYNKTKNWSFSEFEIETESLTNWDLFKILNEIATKDSKILDLGTGGGEKVLKYFPECAEILGTDLSVEMIKTANQNLRKSGRRHITLSNLVILLNTLKMVKEKLT